LKNRQLVKNEIIPLEITDLTLEGSGVGHYDGLAVFVPYTAPGDKINAHIVKVKSKLAYGIIDKILTPSPHRIQADCPVFSKCGGCAFRHIDYETELKIKQNHVKETLKRIGGIDAEVEAVKALSSPDRYRNKAQYPLEEAGGELKIGFYAPRSHRVIDCRDCLLQPLSFEDILSVFDKWISDYNIPVYNEKNHTGLLRHIYIRQGLNTGEIMVCPIINGQKLPRSEELINALLNNQPGIKSIILNINRKDTNVILGEDCLTLWGQDYITDKLCSLNFRLSPLSFYQVNPAAARILYETAGDFAALTGKETVLDLYCGAGTIGLTMAAKAEEVIGVESVPEAVEDAKTNAAINKIKNARFICADAREAAELLAEQGIRPDVIVLDPPRKGCSPDLLKTVAQMQPDRVVYVSCDPATLARDCAMLVELGFEVKKVTPVDMFPRTGHVECVVWMLREGLI